MESLDFIPFGVKQTIGQATTNATMPHVEFAQRQKEDAISLVAVVDEVLRTAKTTEQAIKEIKEVERDYGLVSSLTREMVGIIIVAAAKKAQEGLGDESMGDLISLEERINKLKDTFK